MRYQTAATAIVAKRDENGYTHIEPAHALPSFALLPRPVSILSQKADHAPAEAMKSTTPTIHHVTVSPSVSLTCVDDLARMVNVLPGFPSFTWPSFACS